MLAKHPNVVGLGEIYKTWRDGAEEFCSCGERTEDCPFWSKLLPHNGASIESFYEAVIRRFVEFYGEDMVLLDSSKCAPVTTNSMKVEGVSRYNGLEYWLNGEETSQSNTSYARSA